ELVGHHPHVGAKFDHRGLAATAGSAPPAAGQAAGAGEPAGTAEDPAGAAAAGGAEATAVAAERTPGAATGSAAGTSQAAAAQAAAPQPGTTEAGGDPGIDRAGTGGDTAAVQQVEEVREAFGGAVLHVVDEQLGLAAVASGLVEPGNPLPGAIQIMGPGGGHQQGVEALQGHQPDHAGEGAGQLGAGGRGLATHGALATGSGLAAGTLSAAAPPGSGGRRAAGDGLHHRHHFGDGDVFEGKQANGHAVEHVHVEGAGDVQVAVDLGAAAGEDQQVAQAVDAGDGVVAGHRRQ